MFWPLAECNIKFCMIRQAFFSASKYFKAKIQKFFYFSHCWIRTLAESYTVPVQSSGHIRSYNWARDRSATTLGLSETHAINCRCTLAVLCTLYYITMAVMNSIKFIIGNKFIIITNFAIYVCSWWRCGLRGHRASNWSELQIYRNLNSKISLKFWINRVVREIFTS